MFIYINIYIVELGYRKFQYIVYPRVITTQYVFIIQ